MLLLLRRRRIGAGGVPYADEVNFHLDSLPSLAEEEGVIVRTLRSARRARGSWARRAIAITDKRHPAYANV